MKKQSYQQPACSLRRAELLQPLALSIETQGPFTEVDPEDGGAAKGYSQAVEDSPLEEESGWAGIPSHFTSLWDEDEE